MTTGGFVTAAGAGVAVIGAGVGDGAGVGVGAGVAAVGAGVGELGDLVPCNESEILSGRNDCYSKNRFQ